MEAIVLPCSTCIHFDRVSGTCPAFPDEIPEVIISGNDKHLEPLPDQDNNIVYTKDPNVLP